MTFIAKHFESMISLDGPTLAVIIVFCALASYFLKEYLAHAPMIVFVYPVLVFCSMFVYYIFNTMEFFAPKKLDQWLMWSIMASILGTIMAITLVAGLARMRERLGHRPS
jgi:Na+/phosphate symporter